MLVLGVSRARAEELLLADEGRLELAAVNGPAMVGISGEVAAIEQLGAFAAEQGIWCRRLRADYASHSFLVDELERPMLSQLDGVGERPARGLGGSCRFYSTVESRWIGPDEVLDAGYWFRNLRRPVELEGAVRAVTADMRAVVEVSPHPGLVSPILDVVADAGRSVGVIGTLRRDQGGVRQVWTAMAEAFAIGLPVDWSAAVPGDGPAWRELCRDLPTHPFEHRRYWLRGGGAVAAAEEAVHPLLTTVAGLPDSDGVLAVGRLSTHQQPWLARAAGPGPVEVPASVWVELIIRVGDELDYGTMAELDLIEPAWLDRGTSLSVQVCVGGTDSAGRRPVTVRSAPASADGDRSAWTLNATGLLVSSPAGTDAAESDLTVWPPVDAEPVTPADPRDDVRGVWRRGDETFLELVLPDEHREDAAAFGIHPLLLDAASRAMDRAPGSAARWRDVELHATGAASLRVRLRPAENGIALTAADETGQPVLTAGRIAVRPAREPRLGRPGGVLRTEWAELDQGPLRPRRGPSRWTATMRCSTSAAIRPPWRSRSRSST